MPRMPRHAEGDPEAIALRALTFLLSESNHLSRFMSLTGLGAADLRHGTETRELQIAVLDHILADERLLLSFCEREGIAPDRIAPAHAALAGEY